MKSFREELGQLARDYETTPRDSTIAHTLAGGRVEINGHTLVNFCSTSYLGYDRHPKIVQAVRESAEVNGWGAGSPRLLCGNSQAHSTLESKLAEMVRTQSAIVFPSGYHGNVGVISCLADSQDLILSDEFNHASLIDGIRLSRAKTCVFPHRDTNFVREILTKDAHKFKRIFVVTDSLFSMEGDLARIRELIAIAEHFNCYLYIDDCHGFGVLGEEGGGAMDYFQIPRHHPLIILIGSLGKALGLFGSFVAASNDICTFLTNLSRSFVYSMGLPTPICAGALEALNQLKIDPSPRIKLKENLLTFGSENLKSKHTLIGEESLSPIRCLLCKNDTSVFATSDVLFKKGFFSPPISFPVVPKGTPRIRFSLTACHSSEQILGLFRALNCLAI